MKIVRDGVVAIAIVYAALKLWDLIQMYRTQAHNAKRDFGFPAGDDPDSEADYE